jgi:UDP-N-acetylglucosamine 2-epimerase (non-hydrolysing)
MKPMVIASTRPELIKLSPVMKELDEYIFVTTGQHYDRNLFQSFIKELGLKDPDYDVMVGSGSQAWQTFFAAVELENIMKKERPDVIIVEGDTNSVMSSSLAGVKLGIPVAHVEAGLRSWDRTMPEEINRIIADHCSEILFAPTERAGLNLINEGIHPEKIFIVGNTIVDAVQNLKIAKSKVNSPDDYLVLTLHRAENVDDYKRLKNIVEALERIEEKIIFPAHPRTKKMLEKFGLIEKLGKIKMIDPMGYFEFLVLMRKAKAVLTDSGGIQEEAIVLNVPCITLRTTTERPESIEAGGNVLAGVETEKILEKVNSVLYDKETYERMKRAKNPFGDGKAGQRVVEILRQKYEKGELKLKNLGGERKAMIVDSSLEGKKIKDLDFTVLKIIEKGEKYPCEDTKLKKGQIVFYLKNS